MAEILSRRSGLNQEFPQRLADDLVRRYGKINAEAMKLVRELLIPALIAGDDARVADVLGQIDLAIADAVPDSVVEKDTREIGERLDKRHRTLFFSALAATLGGRIIGTDTPGDEDLPSQLLPTAFIPQVPVRRGRLIVKVNMSPSLFVEDFVQQNVRFIRTLREGVVEAIGDQVAREVILGTGNREELAQRLLEKWERDGVPSRIPFNRLTKEGLPFTVSAESHAAFIAQDQVSKLNSQLSRTRMEAVGINKAEWRDQGDSKVRPQHRAFGRMPPFDLDKGINGIFPGMPPRCRCWSQAVVDPDAVMASNGLIPIDDQLAAAS